MGDPPKRGRFQTTRWSVVLLSRSRDDAAARAALTALCETYWYPLYAWVRRTGRSPEDSADLTQELFTRLIERGDFARADPSRGRFRSFLSTCVKNLLANEYDRTRAQKRGSGKEPVSLDATDAEGRYLLEPAHAVTADLLYEQCWARRVIERAQERLRNAQVELGKGGFFDQVRGTLFFEGTSDADAVIAERLNTTTGALKQARVRLRGEYRKALRAEVADTVDDPADVDDELRTLLASLTRLDS